MVQDNVRLFQSHANRLVDDPLTEILREKAREILALALELEAAAFLDALQHLRLKDGRRRMVRNGYLPERNVVTGIGPVPVRGIRIRDRGAAAGKSIRFRSSILPSYLRRSRTIDAVLPWLYLKGVSTGDFAEALQLLVGPEAVGLSAATICRLKEVWEGEYEQWCRRRFDESSKKGTYVYWWVDGIYSCVRSEEAKHCLLVIIAARTDGKKELLAIEDGYRESELSWRALLLDLKQRGLTEAPKLAVGDGALGFWKALQEVYGEARHQRCWVHKTANVLDKLPKTLQKSAKAHLHEIWMAETKKQANDAFELFLRCYAPKYPKAAACLEKDRQELLTFYDFPAEHWMSLRTTNPIESTFATVRLRTAKTRNCLSKTTLLTMVFKLCKSAETRWRALNCAEHLIEVRNNVIYIDGIHPSRIAA